MKHKLILSLLAIGMLGCGNGRYQIMAPTQESPCHAYRLDTRTGELLCIIANKTLPVEPNEPEVKK